MNKCEIILTKGWRFTREDIEEAWFKAYDDSSWAEVMLPHDWAVESGFRRSNSSGTGYLDGGTGWYRGRFSLPEEYRGKCIRLVFEGVYKNARVWVNSYYRGLRPSGYAEFSYDISDIACFGDTDNEISVKVSHEDIADSRWYTGSGIYRNVRLVIEEPVHPAEYGIVFRADPVSKAAAGVTVRHTVENHSGREAEVQVVSEMRLCQYRSGSRTRYQAMEAALRKDPAEHSFLRLEGTVTVPAGGSAPVTLAGEIKHPALWSPETPNLYELVSEYRVNGESYTVDRQTVGIRKLSFDPQRGFLLNDVPMKMKGVCVHHDAGALGAAVVTEVWHRRLLLLKEMGCNAIRGSHNPHMNALYDLCDTLGFLFLDEAFDEWEGCKNKWSTGHNVYPPRHQGYFEAFPEWHERDLRNMVRRDRNHPSVVMWSIGNEIDYPNDPYCHPMFQTMTGNNDANKPAEERRYDPNKPNMERLPVIAKKLISIVKEEDDSRPVTLAAAFPELSSHIGLADGLDVIGYNYKEALYEADRERFPDRCFLGTENSSLDEAWESVEKLDFVIGQFVWTGIDYLGEARGWPVYGSPAGFLSTAGFPKDSYYRRKALWTGQADLPPQSGEPAVSASVQVWRAAEAEGRPVYDENADGYIYQILIGMQDAEGRLTTEDHVIRCQVTGDGELAGMDSGSLQDLTPFRSPKRKSFGGRLAVYVRRTGSGGIQVRLQAEDAAVRPEQDLLEL